jgi:HK97 family phage major capsid protein
MTIKELREKQAKIVAEARERLDLIDKADEARAKELETQHDAAMAEYDLLEKKIEREEKVAGLEARAEAHRKKQRPVNPDSEARGEDEGEKPTYRTVFLKFLASGADPHALEPEERAMLRQGFDPQADREFRTQTAGTNSAGGYTVPTELFNEIVKSMAATGPMYDPAVTREITTSGGNPIKVPTVDDTSKSAGLHTEGAALTDDNSEDVTFGQKSLDAYVYDTEFLKISMELLQDSAFNVESFIGELLGERLGRKANSILTIGTGSSQPNGIVTASTLGVTAAATGAITFDEIIDLEHAVDPAYRASPKAAYMFNDGVLKAIRKLKDGNGQYIWQMGDVQKGVPPSLNGRRYYINQAMASLATGNKTMIFGDLGKYFVRKIGSPVIGVLRERFWPDLGMAGLVRLDGELSDTAAVKHLIQA